MVVNKTRGARTESRGRLKVKGGYKGRDEQEKGKK